WNTSFLERFRKKEEGFSFLYYRQVCLDNQYIRRQGSLKQKAGPGKTVRLRNLHIKKIFDMM
ncbi:hypothetical protein, partial [Bacteroides caecigallinarum]|uniref:hypothetical protein n=1 Tax=Bacteroides caecigallinarum TaxID=1411144 RepID=UPI00195D2FE6